MLSFQSMKESGKSKYCQTSRNGHLCNVHKLELCNDSIDFLHQLSSDCHGVMHG